MNKVAERLKYLRDGISLSQLKLAEKMSNTQSNIARYENGKTVPPLDVLIWYADFFDVSLDYIFGRTENPQGKLYNYEPNILKEKLSSDEDIQKFVEMCFDPKSPVSAKLRETLTQMIGGKE